MKPVQVTLQSLVTRPIVLFLLSRRLWTSIRRSPNYTEIEQDGGIQSTIQELSAAASAGGLELPIGISTIGTIFQSIAPTSCFFFFNAITTKKVEGVALIIEHNVVMANITDATG